MGLNGCKIDHTSPEAGVPELACRTCHPEWFIQKPFAGYNAFALPSKDTVETRRDKLRRRVHKLRGDVNRTERKARNSPEAKTRAIADRMLDAQRRQLQLAEEALQKFEADNPR